MIKAKNIISDKGNPITNQIIITDENKEIFQSYDSIIVVKEYKPERYSWNAPEENKTNVTLDEYYWNYSRTTSKYRNEFLGEYIDTTRSKIHNGTYKLANLNK